MDSVKNILDGMTEKGIIRDNGKEGHNESSDVMEERILNDEENLSDDSNCSEKNTISHSLKSYINDKFYETLINKIKYEVKLAVDTEIHKNMLLSRNPEPIELNAVSFNADNKINHNNSNDSLINALNSEIKFLRNEVSSKDAIIKLLINDREKPNVYENVTLNKERSFNSSKNKSSVNKDMCKENICNGDKAVTNGDANTRDGFEQFKTVKSRKSKVKKSSTTIRC